MKRMHAIGTVVILTFVFVGCESGPRYFPVKGEVSFNGKPVESGLVHFESADGNSPSAKGGAILDGQYAAQLPPGEWIVRITATRVIGTRKVYEDAPDSPIKEVTEQFLPKQFNTESDLRVKIDAKRDDLHFKLKVD